MNYTSKLVQTNIPTHIVSFSLSLSLSLTLSLTHTHAQQPHKHISEIKYSYELLLYVTNLTSAFTHPFNTCIIYRQFLCRLSYKS